MDTAASQFVSEDTQRGSVVELRGRDVKDLITKFFYKENHLCFHIFLQLHTGDVIFFMEFNDYASYKEVFTELQQQKNSDHFISISKKNMVSGKGEEIVA